MQTENGVSSALENGKMSLFGCPEGLLDIATFGDGSGKHRQNLEWAENAISKEERNCAALRDFIAAHNERLAGLSFSACVGDREINLGGSYRYYRGKSVDVEFFAALWPRAEWKRVKRKYASMLEDDGIRDWVAEVDGITLRIERAECFKKPQPVFPKDGPVRIRRKPSLAEMVSEVAS